MSKRSTLVSLLTVLIFGSVISAFIVSRNENNQLPTPTPIPTQQPMTDASPTPLESITVSGNIISISEQPVGFMNARVVRVQESSGQTMLYVTSGTTIIGNMGQLMTLNALGVGDPISARGNAAEGGVLVSEILVTGNATDGGMLNITPTPS